MREWLPLAHAADMRVSPPNNVLPLAAKEWRRCKISSTWGEGGARRTCVAAAQIRGLHVQHAHETSNDRTEQKITQKKKAKKKKPRSNRNEHSRARGAGKRQPPRVVSRLGRHKTRRPPQTPRPRETAVAANASSTPRLLSTGSIRNVILTKKTTNSSPAMNQQPPVHRSSHRSNPPTHTEKTRAVQVFGYLLPSSSQSRHAPTGNRTRTNR